MSDKDRLVEALMAEQEKFREYLYGLSAEEALSHAYEYIIREDILFALEDMELTEQQARILLSSPAPLDCIYQKYCKLETSYMDDIRTAILLVAKQ